MPYSTLTITQSGGIARLTLARPARKNAIDGTMCGELAAATAALEADASVKVVVLSGQGDAFSVGGDIADFVANKHRLHQHILDMTAAFHAALLSLHRMDAPLVVAVNGVAAGGGFSLALHADLAIARRSARFVSAYTRSGLTPDGGGTWLLPRLVGRQRAFDLMATNPTLTAVEAQALGLVSRVVDDDAFEAAVLDVATKLAALPTGAAGKLKRLLDDSLQRTLAEQLEAESRALAKNASAPETVARLEAFLTR